jgi:hypothetical protein
MKRLLKHKPLGISMIVWALQLLYVAAALAVGVLIVFLTGMEDDQSSHLLFQIVFVLAMLLVNIAWRVRIKKSKPEWF